MIRDELVPVTQQHFLGLTVAVLATGVITALPALAQGFNFGGIVQGAIQSDLQRRQIELQRLQVELERQRQLRFQQNSSHPVAPQVGGDDLPDGGAAPDVEPVPPPDAVHDAKLYKVDSIVLGDAATLKQRSQGINCYPSEQRHL